MLDKIKNKHIIIAHLFLIMCLNTIKGILNKWNYERFAVYLIPFIVVLSIYISLKKTYKYEIIDLKF